MQDELTVTDVLERAYDLLAPPGAWMQKALARTARSAVVSYSDDADDITSMCVVGALHAAAYGHPLHSAVVNHDALNQAFDVLCAALSFPSRSSIVPWNNAPERTHEDVLLALKQAIERSREREAA